MLYILQKKACNKSSKEKIFKELLPITEKIIAITAFEPSWEEVHTYSARSFQKVSWSEELAILFFELMNVADMNVNTLYAEYITKNTLNIFRQNHGYKENTYKKVWNGKEDNVIARSIVNGNPNITPEELMEELQKEYKTL